MQHKNWPEICRMMSRNKALAMALICVGEDKDSERLMEAFPECFSATVINGPVPISIIHNEAMRLGYRATDLTHVLYCVYNLPYVTYSNLSRADGPFNPAPFKAMGIREGEVVEFNGKKWLVINVSGTTVSVCPLECFDLDL